MAAGKTARIIPYDYRQSGRAVRDFFPFHDYDNVLDVRAVKTVYPYQTPFSEGLSAAYGWFCKNRDSIAWKEGVMRNEAEILAEIG